MSIPRRRALVRCSLVLLAAAALSTGSAAPGRPQSQQYQVTHGLAIKDLPADAQRVRIWFWLPDDDSDQKILDLSVKQAPAGYRITRDPINGHRYLYAEVDRPGATSMAVSTEFAIRRTVVSIPLDAAKAGSLTDGHRSEFAEYLTRDVPNMQVDGRIAKLADELCGSETNVVRQARKLYDYVIENTNHYSRPGAPKSSGKGSAEYCLDSKGGACTDQHSLFIALARARGIPTRLHFGSRLQPQNEGKEVDPGYRCWVQYFVPNFGWVPMDISAGNTNPDKRDFYFSGLDERRIHFLEGRNLDLCPKQEGPRLNLMIGAYVEVDGKPHTAFARTMTYQTVPE